MSDSPRSDAMLDSMLTLGDPIADAAIAEAFELGQVHRVNDLLEGFDQNGEPVPADLPPQLRQYFEETASPLTRVPAPGRIPELARAVTSTP